MENTINMPPKWMVYCGKYQSKMDDDWGYPHDLGNPHLCSAANLIFGRDSILGSSNKLQNIHRSSSSSHLGIAMGIRIVPGRLTFSIDLFPVGPVIDSLGPNDGHLAFF